MIIGEHGITKEAGSFSVKMGQEHSPATAEKLRAKPVLCTFSSYSNRVLVMNLPNLIRSQWK